MRNLPNPQQEDLFEKPVFAARQRDEALDLDRFRLRMKTAMSGAIRESGLDRSSICAAIAAMPGSGAISPAMLDAYTAPSKPHDISLARFKALARVLGATGLWDLAICDEGLLILAGDEARLAEIARLEQEERALKAKLKTLRSVPVDLSTRNAEREKA